MLVAEGLRKRYRSREVVRDFGLTLNAGEVVGLLGPNGAGKTTCFNLLTKFLEPTRGQILLEGADITREKPAQVARRGMVRSFQISSTFPHMSVLENVRVALQPTLGTAFNFWQSSRTLEQLNGRCMELLDHVGLAEFASLQAIELPYGRKRVLEIATTLAMEPKLMLLDEPTQGMGHEDVELVMQLIKKVSANRTILMVEHNMSVVGSIADTITVLQFGQVIAEGAYAEVSRNPQVLEAYMGSAEEALEGIGE